MKLYNTSLKNKKILIYKEYEEEDKNSDLIKVKEYVNINCGDYFRAYIRQVSAKEMKLDSSSNYGEEIEITMNYKSYIEIGMLVEYNDDTYRINSLDKLEFLRSEMKLRCLKIKPDEYNEVRWSTRCLK